MRYRPAVSVVADRILSISTGLDASTVAPGSTAPEVSLTVPVIVAWADAAAGATTSTANTTAILARPRITDTLLHKSVKSDMTPPTDRDGCRRASVACQETTGALSAANDGDFMESDHPA